MEGGEQRREEKNGEETRGWTCPRQNRKPTKDVESKKKARQRKAKQCHALSIVK